MVSASYSVENPGEGARPSPEKNIIIFLASVRIECPSLRDG